MEIELQKQFIYILKDPLTNEVRYVGKTNNPENRLKRHMSNYQLVESWTSKNKWLIYLKKQNLVPIMEVIDTGTKENINLLEIKWIAHYTSIGCKLTNGTIGGDGYDWTGRKLTKEHIEKMKMNHPMRKSIVQFDLDNNIIKKFDSSRDAEKFNSLRRNHIIKCCKGISSYNTVGKLYYFRFIDNYFPCKKSNSIPDIDKINKKLDILKNQEVKYITKREEIRIKQKEWAKGRRKGLVQYDLSGNILGKFSSLTEATNKTGIHIYLISNCCKKKGSYTVGGGLFWRGIGDESNASTFRYESDYFDYVPYNKNVQVSSKKVCKYDLNGKFIEVYDSMKSAALSVNCNDSNIASCCKKKINKNGKFIVVKGFTFRFNEETLGRNLI